MRAPMGVSAHTHTIWAKAGPGQGEEKGPESRAGMKACPGAGRGKEGFELRWEGQCLHWPAKAEAGDRRRQRSALGAKPLGSMSTSSTQRREAAPPGKTPGGGGMPGARGLDCTPSSSCKLVHPALALSSGSGSTGCFFLCLPSRGPVRCWAVGGGGATQARRPRLPISKRSGGVYPVVMAPANRQAERGTTYGAEGTEVSRPPSQGQQGSKHQKLLSRDCLKQTRLLRVHSGCLRLAHRGGPGVR